MDTRGRVIDGPPLPAGAAVAWSSLEFSERRRRVRLTSHSW